MNLVPFGWKALLLRARHEPRPLALAFRLLHMSSVQAGWFLDDILYPGWRVSHFKGPLFILGHQRSSTTVLHRALAISPQATGASLGQMILPTLSLWKLCQNVSQLDARFGARAATWVRHRERLAFSALERLHHVALEQVEEDEFFFWTLLASGMCANDCAASMDNRHLDFLRVPASWSAPRRQSVWDWYRDCLHKLAHFESCSAGSQQAPWLVVKNPAFSYRIPELLSNFPNARFIILHRNPCAAIASRLNLIQQIWRLRNRHAMLDEGHVEIIYQDSLRIYRSLERDTSLIPKEHQLSLSSNFLWQQPSVAFSRIEAFVGITAGVPMAIKSKHGSVSPEDFGLQSSRIVADLALLFEKKPWLIT